MAASIATFAAFPMTDLNEKIAPILTTSGLVETFVLTPIMGESLNKIIDARSHTIFMANCCFIRVALTKKMRHGSAENNMLTETQHFRLQEKAIKQ